MGDVTFKLSQAERAEIDKNVNGQGGYQTLLLELQEQLKPDGTLTVDDEQLGRLVRMCRYGSGGFQGRLKAAFRNHVRGLMQW
jgi:hypothetical protein